MSFPDTFEIKYQRHDQTGLVAGFSDDLKGLLVTGRSLEELHEEIPRVAAALIEARFGQKVKVFWVDGEPVAQNAAESP
jgi:hypothetical protein